MILVTGPTGSGKTVSLYTCLNILNQPGVNISTAEDPAEIQLAGRQPGQRQRQGGPHLRRPRCARSCARTRTSSWSAKSATSRPPRSRSRRAQTGHLVLSTLHTNDAPATLMRLLNMGVAPFNIASSVILITAQRLAPQALRTNASGRRTSRRKRCCGPASATRISTAHGSRYGPVGCDHCKGTGYKGRVGIYEVMPISDDMRQLIMRNGNALDIADQAQKEGVQNLRQSGLLKVKAGRDVARGNRGDHQRVTARESPPWPPRSPQRRDTRRQGIHVPAGKASTATTAKCAARSKAASETVVTTNLRRQGIRIVKIKRQTFRGGGRVNEKDITFFTRQLATMLQGRRAAAAGVRDRRPRPQQRALRAADDGHQGPRRGRFQPGRRRSASIRRSSTHCTATWSTRAKRPACSTRILDRLATYKEKILAIKSKIKSALFYPISRDRGGDHRRLGHHGVGDPGVQERCSRASARTCRRRR